jgi:hypothetical protein
MTRNSLRIAPALVLALAAAGAHAARPASRPAARTEQGGWIDLRLELLGGAFQGRTVRHDSGGVAIAEAAIIPALRTGDWKFELPLHLSHRQTFGAPLPESKAAATAIAEWRATRHFRVTPEAGLSAALRPGWPDLYQRQADGTLPPTDRYSYFSWHAGASLSLTPFPHHHPKLRYRYLAYRYRADPNFQADIDPMHITPVDHGTHEVQLTWRATYEEFAAAAGVDYQHRQDLVLLARNAGTGTTTGYSNPLQRLDLVEPSVEGQLRKLGGQVDVTLYYGFLLQNDPFQGYYSYRGHHPRLEADYAATDSLRIRARLEAWILRYGPNSTSASRLKSGDRRYDNRVEISGELAYRLTETLTARLDARWVKRDTNYPDYVPGVYPATRFYDIQWDYVNTEVLLGIEYRR